MPWYVRMILSIQWLGFVKAAELCFLRSTNQQTRYDEVVSKTLALTQMVTKWPDETRRFTAMAVVTNLTSPCRIILRSILMLFVHVILRPSNVPFLQDFPNKLLLYIPPRVQSELPKTSSNKPLIHEIKTAVGPMPWRGGQKVPPKPGYLSTRYYTQSHRKRQNAL